MRAPEFWQSKRFSAKACTLALSPLGMLYGLSVQARRGLTHPDRAKAKVICVGNLTAGGSGKTPIALALGEMLARRGKRIAFLTRGYGGSLSGPLQVDPARHSAAQVGDEALLLAAMHPTILARNRAWGAKLADALDTDVIVMDDGFQNFRLAKDLAFVVVDAATGFGNGRLIPAGPLREPPARGLARADAVVLMGNGNPGLPDFAGPVLRAQILPLAPETLAGRPVFAFAGIGRPEKFFAMLESCGARLLDRRAFADHHHYAPHEIFRLKQDAERHGAIPVTTEKDFVRLTPENRSGIVAVAVRACFDDEAVLNGLLDRVCDARA